MSDGLATNIPTHTGKQDDCPFGEEVPYGNGKTWCQTCAGSGSPTLLDGPLPDQDLDIQGFIDEQVVRLRLHDWDVTYERAKPTDIPDGSEQAYVSMELNLRRAVIRIDESIEEGDRLEWLILHELVHVVLSELAYIACNGRPIEIMEAYSLFEERVCNALADAL